MTDTRVGNLAEQIRGVTYKKADIRLSPASGFVPLLGATNVVEGRLVFGDPVFVPERLVKPRQMLQPGDVLIATSSGSKKVVGKAATITDPMGATFGAFCKVLRPRGAVETRYFQHFFQTDDYRRRISAASAGANINNLRSSDLDDLIIPLPEVEEQRRIAAILTQGDKVRRVAVKTAELAARLPRAVHRAMFSVGGPGVKGARLVSIGQALRLRSGDFLPASARIGQGYPVYGSNGVIGRHECYSLDEPVVTIGRVGACGAVHVTPSHCWVTDNALYVADRGEFELDYLAEALDQADLGQYASRSTQPLISYGRITDAQILLPTTEWQREYSLRLAAVRQECGRQDKRANEVSRLFASLQGRAFSGQL